MCRTYLKAVIPPTAENKYQIAERLLRESLPVFRLHYREDNKPIVANECKLAYTLAMQKKWDDFDEHYKICRQGSANFEDLTFGEKEFFRLIENALKEKNING